MQVRKATVRRPKQELAAQTMPQQVAAIEESDKQETDRNMEEMWSLLKEHPEVPALRVILNHSSFAQTVENLFTLSFLVRSCCAVRNTQPPWFDAQPPP